MKARLRTKLIAAVALYVLLLAGVGWLGLSAAQSSLDGMHAAIQHHVREVAIVGELAREASSIQATSILHIATDDPDERQRTSASCRAPRRKSATWSMNWSRHRSG